MKPNELQHLLKSTIRVPIEEEKATIEMDENLVMVPRMEYANLVSKAAMLDILSDDLKARLAKGESYPIKDEIVMAVTRANRFRDVLASEREEAQKQAEEDSKKIAGLEDEMETLKAELSVIRNERDNAMAEIYNLKAGYKSREVEPHE